MSAHVEDEEEGKGKRFFEDLMTMIGEVPVETLVRKARGETGDYDAALRHLMGHAAFWVKCELQNEPEAINHRRINDTLEFIIALSGETAT
jgi:hypothetical protein